MPKSLFDQVVDHYAYQKEALLRRGGVHKELDRDAIARMVGGPLQKMADLAEAWNADPGLLMEAAFAYARRGRHPDGPMPNMLGSAKYLCRAWGSYCDIPFEAVVQKRSTACLLEQMDRDFDRTREDLRGSVVDLSAASTYPVEHRYLLAVGRMDRDAMFYLAQELLEVLARDRRVALWAAHRGIRYEDVANQFNRRLAKENAGRAQ